MKNKEAEAELLKIFEKVRDIEYGTITIHIQDGKVVFIEKTEKIKIKG